MVIDKINYLCKINIGVESKCGERCVFLFDIFLKLCNIS